MNDNEFNVVEFYDDGYHTCVERAVNAEYAVKMAALIVHAIELRDADINIGGDHRPHINKIIITDGGDDTVFQWEHGKGVTFPEQPT
jgi:hypothetical protein